MDWIARTMALALAGLMCWSGAWSQRENDVWYFGNGAGVTFSGGAPVGIPGGQTTQLEGTTTLSDGGGNLLMYSDGQSIWDRNHNAMPNGTGLLSGTSSAMAAVIVPQPCNFDAYYLFVVNDRTGGAQASLTGLTYSRVDMSLNSGNGDIVQGQKNLLLDSISSEKISCTRHANGRDVWIVHRSATALKAYLLTPTGLVTTAVVSAISSYNDQVSGVMKMSPDGSRMASCAYNFVELFDFDPATGAFSNLRTISDFLHYGTVDIEFSSGGRYLYWSYGNSLTGSKISHLDLDAGNAAAILASDSVIATTQGGVTFTALCRGRDDKIYVGDWSLGTTSTDYLSVIGSPDQPAMACNFSRDVVALSPGTYCLAGLTNRVVGRTACVLALELQHFTVTQEPGGRLISWETGDVGGQVAFVVERSDDGNRWEVIGEVSVGAGSSGDGRFSFVDQERLAQAIWYRLAGTNVDGMVTCSEVRYISGASARTNVVLGPQPADDRIRIGIGEALLQLPALQVYDVQGQKIEVEVQLVGGDIEVKTAKLPAGRYVFSWSLPTQVIRETFTVLH